MKRHRLLTSIFFLLGASVGLQAQTPQELKMEIEKLRREMEGSRAELSRRLKNVEAERDELKKQVQTGAAERKDLKEKLEQAVLDADTTALDGRLDELTENIKFYLTPKPGEPEDRPIFGALQGGLVFTGLFRTRFEYRADNVDFNDSDSGFDDEGVRLAGRFKLGFGAVVVDDPDTDVRITALMEIQAEGYFSDNTQTLGFAGAIAQEPFGEADLYKAYLDFEELIATGVRLRIGRQELVFGSQLMLGNNSFFGGATHGAVLAEWRNELETLKIAAFYAKEAQSDRRTSFGVAFPPPPSDFDDDQFAGLYISTRPGENLAVDIYGLHFDDRSPSVNSGVTLPPVPSLDGMFWEPLVGNFWTLGARVFWGPIDLYGGSFSVNAEAAYQTGSNRPGAPLPDQSIHGWTVEFLTNYRFDRNMEGLAPVLTVGYYYAGGGNGLGTGTHIGFQPLFLNRHFDLSDRGDGTIPYFPGGGRYGNMDLIPLSNMHIVKAALSVAPTENLEVGLAWHLAVTADDEGYGTGVYGHEADLFAVYRYDTGGEAVVQFSANFSVFFPQKTSEDLSNLLIPMIGGIPPGVVGAEASDDLALAFYLEALVSF